MEHPEINEIQPSRRRFLQIAIGALNGIFALLLSIPGLGFLLTPVLRKPAAGWIRVGPVSQFRSDGFSKALFTYISESGYTREERQGFVWLRVPETGEEEIRAFSPVCSHAGCNVAWQPAAGLFKCPCHDGTYNNEGLVLSGPPPRPLEKLSVKVENDEVYVQLPA